MEADGPKEHCVFTLQGGGECELEELALLGAALEPLTRSMRALSAFPLRACSSRRSRLAPSCATLMRASVCGCSI
eukprot:scaffold133687_cov31-Tisochrysis_lutea.AAC.2